MRALALAALLLILPACATRAASIQPPQTPPDIPTVPPIRIRVYPRVAIPPIDVVRIEILIARHVDNREYCLVVDGPGLYSSSCEGLPGQRAAFLYVRAVLGLLVEGRYLVKAELYRAPNTKDVYAFSTDVVQAGTELSATARR